MWSEATIDFTQFVEIRVLQPGFTSVSEWIQLFGPGTSALVTVCSDLNCGNSVLESHVIDPRAALRACRYERDYADVAPPVTQLTAEKEHRKPLSLNAGRARRGH